MNCEASTFELPQLEGETAFAKVRSLRIERGESGEQFGAAVGLSKGKVSELEAGAFRPGPRVAVAIEELSGGRIDAAALSDDVKIARHGLGHTPEGAQDHVG